MPFIPMLVGNAMQLPNLETRTSPLIGEWIGDPARYDLHRVVIRNTPRGLVVHVWAYGIKGHDDIDWGERPVEELYAANVSSKVAVCGVAKWSDDYFTGRTIFRVVGRSLIVEDMTHFTDRSGRSDYLSFQALHRRLLAQPHGRPNVILRPEPDELARQVRDRRT